MGKLTLLQGRTHYNSINPMKTGDCYDSVPLFACDPLATTIIEEKTCSSNTTH